MATYNYKRASDLVKYCKSLLNQPTRYVWGGIGRYENGVRLFDCIGMVKSFLWHDYSQYNTKYYGVTCPDFDCEAMFKRASEKGNINTIPEVEGVIVYQKGHVGVYIGNGEVIEATAGFTGKVLKTHFKGNHKTFKRTSWTHWFKMPELEYASVTIVKKYSLDEMVQKVIDGEFGNYPQRKSKIEALGWNYETVQKEVDKKLTSKSNKKYSLDEMVQKTIDGEFGNYPQRKSKIEALGWNYETVQKEVDKKLGGK